MAMEVNGAAVLAAIVKTPAAFAMVESQVNSLAMAALLDRLKDKSVGLDQIKSIASAIGSGDFKLILDTLSSKDLAALTKRLDSKHPELRGASDSWHRQQIWLLASGAVAPLVSAIKVAPKPKSTETKGAGSKTGEVMGSKALKPKTPPKVARPRVATPRTPKQ